MSKLDALHQLEIAWLLLIRALGDWLAVPMQAITMLGSEEFFMLVMPSLYWCIDSVLGFRVAVMLLLSNGVNHAFKLVFHSPRPYWFDERITPMSVETSFGIPSGHAQHAVSIWGVMATGVKSKWQQALLVVVIFLIGFSRLYLGMHFISDVVAGWLLGGLLLWAFLKLEKPAATWLRTLSYQQMLIAALGSSLLIMVALLLAGASLGNWQVPEAWETTLAKTQPAGVIDPLSSDNIFTIAGTWLGLMVGAAWYYHRFGRLFNSDGLPWQRLLRYVVGVAGILVLWYGLGKVFPRNEDILSYSLRYMRYTLVGLWISAAAPILFERMGLAVSRKPSIPSLSAN